MNEKKLMPKGFWERFEEAISIAYQKGSCMAEISRDAGYSPHALSQAYTEKRTVSCILLYELSKVSGHSMEWFFTGKEDNE